MSLLPAMFRKRATELTEAIGTEQTVTPEPDYSKDIVPYDNPFNREDIKNVHVWYRKFWATDTEFTASGSIEFRRGDTTGKQEFKGSTIEDVLEQMAKFVKSL